MAYFQPRTTSPKAVKISYILPEDPLKSKADETKALAKGKKFFKDSFQSVFTEGVAPRSAGTNANPAGTYYTGAAADYNGISWYERDQMNYLQQDLLVLNARVNADYTRAMTGLLANKTYTMPDSGLVLHVIQGENDYDTRLKNSFPVWRAAFDNAQVALQSFYTIAEESDAGYQSWRGDTVSLNFTDEILSRFMSGYDKEIVEAISNKFKTKQVADMTQAQSYDKGDYNNVLLTTVIYVDGITRKVGATLCVTVFNMDHGEATKIKCGVASASGHASYTFEGIQYSVNAGLLRKQVGNNQGAIDNGKDWFGSSQTQGQATITGDPDAKPNFFG